MLAYDYPILNIFWTMTFFFIWAAWIFVVIWVFIDNFSRHDHGGLAKAIWTLVIVFLPLFGVFIYLVSRPRIVEVDYELVP